MKKYISIITFLALSTLLVLTGCCKKSEPIILKNALPGTWDFESLKIASNEHIGTVLQSGFIRFDPMIGEKGNFHQEVAFIGTRVEILTGTYELMEAPGAIRMEAGEKVKVITLKIDPKDTFVWEGDLEGKKEIIIAKRRK